MEYYGIAMVVKLKKGFIAFIKTEQLHFFFIRRIAVNHQRTVVDNKDIRTRVQFLNI